MVKKFGYLGPSGTFSEEAALKYCQDNDEIVPFKSIGEIVENVRDSELQGGIIPAENSLEGSVNLTMDLLLEEESLEIVDELILPIRQYLMAPQDVNLDDINKLFSHIQAIRQSRCFIENFLPGVEIVFTDSTSQAVEQVIGRADRAMIGSKRIIKLYDLRILAEDIQENFNNYTRFLVIGRASSQSFFFDSDMDYKTSIICTPQVNKAGILHQILGEFSRVDINLTRIESRPTKTQLGEYMFFIDLEGHRSEKRVMKALDGVKKRSRMLKILGSYRKARIKRGSSEYVRRKA